MQAAVKVVETLPTLPCYSTAATHPGSCTYRTAMVLSLALEGQRLHDEAVRHESAEEAALGMTGKRNMIGGTDFDVNTDQCCPMCR